MWLTDITRCIGFAFAAAVTFVVIVAVVIAAAVVGKLALSPLVMP